MRSVGLLQALVAFPLVALAQDHGFESNKVINAGKDDWIDGWFDKRDVLDARSSSSNCTNGPTSRGCWSAGYDITTNTDNYWPNTGVTRYFDVTITNTTCNPDGAGARQCMLFNGGFPGPTLYANWGDYINFTVHNQMQNNGTSIHFHGMRQLNTVRMDGTNGVTECPVAPSTSRSYVFQATQYGTSWYHSHYSVQYGDGVSGQVVVNGPASANYDTDLGTMPITDWFTTKSAWQENIQAAITLGVPGPPPPPDNVLMNGTNMAPNSTTKGKFYQTNVDSGKTYRMRLINTAVDNSFYVSLDNHPFTIIAADFVPIKPQVVNFMMMAPGQRYDVLFTTNKTASNYWLRATTAVDCETANGGMGLSILHYNSAPQGTPTASKTPTYTANGCKDVTPLTPYVIESPGNETSFRTQARSLDFTNTKGVLTNGQSIGVWNVNMSQLHTMWSMPTMGYLIDHNTSYPSRENVIALPTLGVWTYWILQEVSSNAVNIAHPMHLHGHDFYILGVGNGTFNGTTDPDRLNFYNPTKRDTIQLNTNGWAALAWKVDNPGPWLFHCHIAWHASWGFGVQYLEATNQTTLPGQEYTTQCNNWKSYYSTAIYKQGEDSGV